MLAGCPFIKTSTSTSVPTAPTSSSSSSPDSPESASSSDSDADSEKEPVIVGRPIEEAKKTMQAAGYKGQFAIYDLSEFDKDCKADTVCRVDPSYWYPDRVHRVVLYKNRGIAIAVPE
mgnify:CR=1 FL=1